MRFFGITSDPYLIPKDTPLHPLLLQQREQRKQDREKLRLERIAEAVHELREEQKSKFIRLLLTDKVLSMSPKARLEWLQETHGEFDLHNDARNKSLELRRGSNLRRKTTSAFGHDLMNTVAQMAESGAQQRSKKVFAVWSSYITTEYTASPTPQEIVLARVAWQLSRKEVAEQQLREGNRVQPMDVSIQVSSPSFPLEK